MSIAHIRFTIKVATEEVISPPPCQDSPHQEENGVGGNRSIFLEFLAIFLKARRDFPHPTSKTVHLQFTMHAVWLTKHVNNYKYPGPGRHTREIFQETLCVQREILICFRRHHFPLGDFPLGVVSPGMVVGRSPQWLLLW